MTTAWWYDGALHPAVQYKGLGWGFVTENSTTTFYTPGIAGPEYKYVVTFYKEDVTIATFESGAVMGRLFDITFNVKHCKSGLIASFSKGCLRLARQRLSLLAGLLYTLTAGGLSYDGLNDLHYFLYDSKRY